MIPGRLSDIQRLAWLRLARTETVGPVAFDHLLTRYGTPERALSALPDLSRRGGRAAPLAPPPRDTIERELEIGEKLGARLICGCEPDFPPRLAALDPPPPVLWARGRAELLSQPSIAIVGARIASAAGQRFARNLAADLGTAGYVVVSGMARGIDGAAHEGALTTGTVAVLGGGIDDVYPPEHDKLHAQLAAEGCIVSESAPDRRAQAKDFPRRNRIIAGLSQGVVVVEAELKSGSLITARLAAEQGRDVFAVPGSPLDPRSRGTNDLIRQGAILCEGAEDVLRSLAGEARLRERDQAYDAEPPSDLDPDALRERVAALLSPTPVPRNDLIRAVAAPASTVMAALVELSLAGRAELLDGGLVAGV
ncbi:DNA-processing protein DprA [Caulobacter sp. BP25]|uniref:DNA-processing protein DprA n=1 Tax=Caulobacter sp. BP25 TaxID=2048900 RepID=UPI000C129ADB|nr:DNA-processing protein DprA [Caulobacter sp. BP25]PHY20379.1 DNA-protecting protein DprA [Caulobacter sp. BP25]